MSWRLYAFISATAAALTAILAKVGVEGVPSNLATAIRTIESVGWRLELGVALMTVGAVLPIA
jgi:bacterial/archaeal transporter family protein